MQWFRKILAQLLILLVLVYSGGLSVSKHLCKGEVVSRALNGEAEVCLKAKEAQALFNLETSFSERSCCDTQSDFFQSDSFSKEIISANFSLDLFDFESPRLKFPVGRVKLLRIANYTPPPLLKIPSYVVFEQYLI